MTNYYVYYRIEGSLASFRSKVEKLFEQIQNTSGVRGRWLRRRDDPATCMEIYEGVTDEKAFEAVLRRAEAAFGVPRKTEVFVSVVS